MDLEKKVDDSFSSNDVIVVISNITEGAKIGEQNRNAEELDKFESGSCSFSRYLSVSPPIFQLSETNKVIPSTSSTSGTERMQQIPDSDEKSVNSLTRRRSIKQSAYSKPKSRLVESSYPITKKVVEEKSKKSTTSPNAILPHKSPPTSKSTTPRTPRTPVIVSLAEEDDEDKDDDLYKRDFVQVSAEKKKGKKFKIMFLIELSAFICILGVLACSLTVNTLRKSRIWSLEIWKWSVLVLVIFCGRLVTEWCTDILVFLFERNYFMKKKVLYFVYSLKNSFRIVIWLSSILSAWSLLINREANRSAQTKRILNYITRALVSSLIGAAMWTLKTLVVKLLASSFHVKRFFDRIQESIFQQYVLQTLSGHPAMEFSAKSSGMLSFKNIGKKIEKQEVVDVEKLHKIKREKVSAWTMGGLVQLIRNTGLSTIVDSIEESVDDEGNEQKEKEITNVAEAKAAAYKIFKNVAKPRSKHIDEEDLLRFMTMEEVDNVLPFFEGAVETGKIKKLSFYNWVVKVYNERKYLAHSLNDTKTAIEELNKIVSGIVLVVILIVWVHLMDQASTRVLIFISSHMLLVVFIFGNTAKTVFEGLVFVFIMHPFDVGDKCVIDGIQMMVEEMSILTTVFLRYDNEKIFYPNSTLAIKPISNFNRSPEMGDSVEFAVDVSTSAENIAALKAKIKLYLESKPRLWQPDHSLQVKEIEDVNKMKMGLYITHTINFQSGERGNRRSDLVLELKRIFEEIGIKFHLLPQEVQLRYLDASSALDATRR